MGNTLYLQVAGTTAPISWAGGNGAWDINDSGNLIWNDNTPASTFYQQTSSGNDAVVFDDTASGTSPIDVALNTTVNPVSVTANLTNKNYAIGGSGAIAGTTSLTKSGPDTLTLFTANTYTGATTVNGGTLALSGSGALATNSAITINGGTLNLGSQNATNFTGNNGISFGANGGNLNGTGTDYMFGTSGGYTAFTVAANASAVINENLNITNLANSGYFNLVNAGSGGMLTINGVVTALNNSSGLFLTGGGALTLNNPANNFSAILFNSGTLITTNFAALGYYPYLGMAGQGVGNGPCTFSYGGPAASTSRNITGNASIINLFNNGGGLVTFTSSSFNSRYGGAQTGSGQQFVLGGTSDMAFAGVIADNTAGTYVTGVVKTNGNTVTLYGNSTYSGATTIESGALMGVVGGSCSNSAVTVAAITGSSAILGVTVTNTTKQWTVPSLTVNNGGVGSGLQFNFGSVSPSATVAPLNITGAATFTTTPGITVTGSSLPVSSGSGYPLMTWGSGGPATTNGMTLSLPAGIVGSLAIAGDTLYLQVTVGSATGAPDFKPGGFSYNNGTVSLIATGAIGGAFRLWASTNLALKPVTNTWTLLTNATVTASPFTITDPGAATNQQRFYLFTAP